MPKQRTCTSLGQALKLHDRPVQAEPQSYGDNEDAEYIDVVWGIRRVPVVCSCGTSTRVPFNLDGKWVCGPCWRVAYYGH